MDKKNMSARSFDRILRVSRTIADLELAQTLPSPGYTQEYMAPEQLNSEVNAYTDIYQLDRIIEELVEISGAKRGWKNLLIKPQPIILKIDSVMMKKQ